LHTQAFYRFAARFGKQLTASFILVGLFSAVKKFLTFCIKQKGGFAQKLGK
jgi:hypothetical protein